MAPTDDQTPPSDTPSDEGGPAQRSGESLARSALADPRDASLAERIQELTPEEAARFVQALELALRKRRLLLAGYLVGMLVLLGGSLSIFYLAARYPGDVGAAPFLLPLAGCGAVLWFFGRRARCLRPPPQ